ncbi:MAG: hypothetical protein WC906_00500 [Parcubacteria group bacterium]|jgi:hypothetical protein
MYNFHSEEKNNSILNQKIPTLWLVLALILASFFTSIFVINTFYETYETPRLATTKKPVKKPMAFEKIERPVPKPVSMERLKKQGCVADGLLSEYNPDREQYISLINRSNCYYLHRAVETWMAPPDFETIEYVMNRISKKDVVYGIFIAEALKENANYFYPDENRNFDFKKMCQAGSENIWGEHSCKADFGSGEYRAYLKYITHRAIDSGIQSFTFGQIYFQQGGGGDKIADVIKEMRSYAKKKKTNIVIGAQTGKITNQKLISLFDYIEGGTGIDSDGNLPQGPCLDRWGGCWALLWNETYSKNAKNVLLHLDWSGIKSDDLDIFSRMDREKRAETLKNLYSYFSSKNMGFLMPFFGVLDKENGGCYGPKKRFYSPDNNYSCKDEDAINSIIKQ